MFKNLYIKNFNIKRIVLFTISLGIFVYLQFIYKQSDNKGKLTNLNSSMVSFSPRYAYGYALDTFEVKKEKIDKGESLGTLLEKNGITNIQQICDNIKHVFDIRKFRTGKEYTVLNAPSDKTPDYFIYETDKASYLKIDIKNGKSELVVKPSTQSVMVAKGEVKSTLWDAMTSSNLDYELASKMEEALKCAVDFHHTRKGDQFKLVFEQTTIDGKNAGVGQLLGAYFKQGDKENYAFYYDNGEKKGFFDMEGRPMKKGFLRAPLKFANITSNFSKARLHPILNYVRPHFGTDYAAPKGTPILAVADGTVEAAEYGGGNGNFVKIKHDNKYASQYLHMSGFAKGVRRGSRVEQGQVIGYVGMTGLATGPHVCFRFWKNGVQVNHLKENLPRPQPMDKSDLEKYFPVRDGIIAQMNQIKSSSISSTTNHNNYDLIVSQP